MKKIIAIALCCLILTACTSAAEPTIPTIAQVSTEEPTQIHTEVILHTFTLYSGNDNADGFDQTEVTVPEINESVILDKLIEAGVFPSDVTINSFSLDGTQLNIDFNSAFLNYLCTMGTSGEMMLVGSVVQTFLDAYEAECVIITSDGNIMESGHIVYDFPMTAADFVY